jgi:Fe-S-cluster containining protein
MSDQEENSEKKIPWYRDGLSFACNGCGKCCSGPPGYIWVTEEEMAAMAERMNLTLKAFQQKYARYIDGRYSLREKTTDHQTFDCIFLAGKKCTIYDLRPKQCRTFPWWPAVLETKESWNETASYCEGIVDTAPLIPFEEIEQTRIKV